MKQEFTAWVIVMNNNFVCDCEGKPALYSSKHVAKSWSVLKQDSEVVKVKVTIDSQEVK